MTEESISKTVLMMLILMPAMLIRQVGEVFKSLYKGLGIFMKLSVAINIIFVIFLVIAFLTMEVFNLGLVGYAISLTSFTTMTLVVCLSFFFFSRTKTELRNNKFGLFTNLGWLFWEGVKGLVPYLLSWVVNELMIVPISLMHSQTQLTAFAVVFVVPNIVFCILNGFTIYLLNQLNAALAKKQFKLVNRRFWLYTSIVTIMVLIFSIICYIVLNILADLQDNLEVSQAIYDVSLSCAVMTFAIGLRTWMTRVMITFEKKMSLSLQSLVFDTLIRVPLEFTLILVLDFKLSGHFYSAALVQVVVLIQVYQCANSDFKEFVGIK